MQQILDFPVQHRYDFESFIPCSGNATALEFARRVTNPEEPEKLLYLYGPPGSGKTHLLHAISTSLPDGCQVLSGPEIAVMARQSLADTVDHCHALLVDDIDKLPDDPALRNILWEGFNRCYNSGRLIVFSGGCPPKELSNLDDHLISRLLWGLVAQMDVSDDRSRSMILAKLAADWQVAMPDDVTVYLLSVLPRDVDSLLSGFSRLYKHSMATQRKISQKLARELFSPS